MKKSKKMESKCRYTMADLPCSGCINSLFGPCSYSRDSAACLYSRQDWHKVTLKDIEQYAASMQSYYEEVYKFRLREIERAMNKVKKWNSGNGDC